MAPQSAQRVALHHDPQRRPAECWHCGIPVSGKRFARYLYPGERPRTAIVEDWFRCVCGAFANVRRTTEIVVSPVRP